MRSLIFTIFLCLCTQGMAHPGAGSDHRHDQPTAISESKAEHCAMEFLEAKVKQGKLSDGWLQKKPAEAYQKSFGYGPEWVVEFHDPSAPESGKRTLYVFMSTSGKLLGVNFTGQ